MSYISLSAKEIHDMLAKLGLSSLEELFRSISSDIRVKSDLEIPGPLTEIELMKYFQALSRKNEAVEYVSFLGAGAYDHIIPAVVDYLSSRGEFISPYTPYQPEVSQGTLQIIFEFQTLICQLTGMDIANASLYDGASGAAESVLMAHRLQKKPKVLVLSSVHPEYKRVVNTYIKNMEIQIEEIPFTEEGTVDFDHLQDKMDDNVSAILCQSPNFFGVIEDLKKISEIAHEFKALSAVMITEPLSLGLLQTPGELGADIVSGEAQSFGIPVSFGGPHIGFMACSMDFVRQFPGRIAGQTKDLEGRRGFVLTLSTREQHIRRERATSNICTNQAWCALRTTIFLETLGKKGLREMAVQNIQKAKYIAEGLSKIQGIYPKFSGRFFNEFVLEFERPWEKIRRHLLENKIIGGLSLENYYPELKNCALFCVTEKHTKAEIEKLMNSLRSFNE